MTDGGKVARRSTRAFVDDFHPGHKKTSGELNGPTVRGREEKISEMEPPSSRESSVSSGPITEFEMELRKGTVKDEVSLEVAKAASLSKSLKEKTTENRPLNFGVVMPGVYRSAYPRTEDYEYLKSLGLKTIVTLVQGDYPKGYQAYMQSNEIKHIVFDIPGTKKAKTNPATMISTIQVLLDRRNYPLLIHCNHGKHRTGCVVAVLRKVMGWGLQSIVEEYNVYAHPKAREVDIAYIQSLDMEKLPTFNGLTTSDSLHKASWALAVSRVKMGRMLIAATILILLWAVTATRISVQL